MLLLYDKGSKKYFFVTYLAVFLKKIQNFGLTKEKKRTFMSFGVCVGSYFPLNSQFEEIRPVLEWLKLKKP